jgi:transposase
MSSTILTRTFSLLPEPSDSVSYKRFYKEITDLLVKTRALKNEYVSLMVSDLSTTPIKVYSSTSMARFRQAVYDRLNFSKVTSPQFQAVELKERAKQCAFYDAYISVRERIKRVETLRAIIFVLSEEFGKDNTLFASFLSGMRLNSSQLRPFRTATGEDCFGERQKLSNFFLNNFIFQVRNVFLAENDFTWSEMISNNDAILPLQAHVEQEIRSLDADDAFIERVLGGFSRTKKKKVMSVLPEALPEYFLNGYVRKVQWLTTKQAGHVISLRQQYEKEKKRKSKLEKLEHDSERVMGAINSFFEGITLKTLNAFKRERKSLLTLFKDSLIPDLGHVDLNRMILEAFHLELSEFRDAKTQYVLKRLFKPSFPRIRVSELSRKSFMDYMTQHLQYKVRELLKEHFLTPAFMKLVITQLEQVQEHLPDLAKLPQHRTLSISIMNRDVYREVFHVDLDDLENDHHSIQLGLISREFKSMKVKDDKHRINSMKARGFEPLLPRITLKDRKLLLHLPFNQTREKKDHSKPSSSKDANSAKVGMGIDLGLKHLATISIWNEENKSEMARYFLGPKQLLDMIFDESMGKFRYQSRLQGDENVRNPSNIKSTLIRLRQQISELQRRKNEYEQRCLERTIMNYKKRLKWNVIRRQLSQCWVRVYCINLQLVDHLNSCIMKIARFWNVSTIKVEDLRFSTHSRKQDAGLFIAFWQVHWFHSHVQQAIKLQSTHQSISFRKVSARNTSKRCSCCGKLGNRSGKQFICPHCGLSLDADLNAARNIVK